MQAEGLRAEGEGGSSRAALVQYDLARRLYGVAGDFAREASAIRRAGETFQELGEGRPALSALNQALDTAIKSGDVKERVRVLNSLCSLQTDLGNQREAHAKCSAALELSREAHFVAGEAQALTYSGAVYYWDGDLRKALDYEDRALALWAELDDSAGRAQALLMKGYVQVIVGELKEAQRLEEQALSLFESVENHRGHAQTLGALGGLHAVGGSGQKALEYYGRALASAERMKNARVLAEVNSGMGFVYFQLGDLDGALRYRERALDLYSSIPDIWGECSLNMSVGKVYAEKGEWQKALEHFRRGLAIAQSMSNAHLGSALLREIGAVYGRRSEWPAALEHYRKALALGRRGGDPRDEADALDRMGSAFLGLGRAREALEYFGRALPLTRSVADGASEARVLSNSARAHLLLGQLDEARTQVESALGIVESLRTGVAGYQMRASYLAAVRSYYELRIEVLARLERERPNAGFAEAAFEASEAGRARTLLESLKESLADIRRGVDPSLTALERELQQSLNAKAERRMQLLASGQKDEAAEVGREIDDLAARYDEIGGRIRESSPRYAALTRPRPVVVEDVRKRLLDDDTLLLEYHLGEERGHLWAITREGMSMYDLPPRREVEQAAREFYEALTAGQQRQNDAPGEARARAAEAETRLGALSLRLSEQILGPAASQLGKKRILVVPDGALQYVPFHALPPPGGGEPLVSEHEVVIEPSASALSLLLEETASRRPPPNLLAIIADPVFEADDPRLARDASAVESSENSDKSRDAEPLGPGVWKLTRLLPSRWEADSIGSLAPAGTFLKAVDFDANRALATGPALQDYRVVHFATHALLDDDRPELSGLALSLYGRDGRPQEGFLRLHEIYNLNLSADLVVLSACSTALGRDMRGEGLVGLTRGFMYAGASGIVSSLWKVDDEATAELMKRFYSRMLEGGMKPAAALREAQNSIRAEPQWRSPFYWAAFNLQGDYKRAVTAPGVGKSNNRLLMAAAAVMLAALGGGAWWLARRRLKPSTREELFDDEVV
jgi:CHAT domain-containing protein/Tfp pilus assembly protein PilF